MNFRKKQATNCQRSYFGGWWLAWRAEKAHRLHGGLFQRDKKKRDRKEKSILMKKGLSSYG